MYSKKLKVPDKTCFLIRRKMKKLILMLIVVLWLPLIAVAAEGETASGQDFSFVQLCDPQGKWKNFKTAVDQINQLKPDFVLLCGDLLKDPKEKAFAEFNMIKAGFKMPVYCVAGNHDIGGKGDPKHLAMYRKEIGKDYYSFEHKGIVFVGINTQLWKVPIKRENEKHDAWLKATLDSLRKKKKKIVLFGHHPFFLKKADEKETKRNLPVAKRAEMLDLIKEYDVVAFLTGHTHRRIIRKHNDIPLVTAGAISLTSTPEFALWTVRGGVFEYRFVPLLKIEE